MLFPVNAMQASKDADQEIVHAVPSNVCIGHLGGFTSFLLLSMAVD